MRQTRSNEFQKSSGQTSNDMAFIICCHYQLALPCTNLQAINVSPTFTPNFAPLLPSVKPTTTAPFPSSISSNAMPIGCKKRPISHHSPVTSYPFKQNMLRNAHHAKRPLECEVYGSRPELDTLAPPDAGRVLSRPAQQNTWAQQHYMWAQQHCFFSVQH